MIYFAHRGASRECVQNTQGAFARARELGATHYELDVHCLKDGALAVHHDYEVGGFPLSALTRADLPKISLTPDGKQKAFIPVLEDVLPVVLPELNTLNIEIKNDDNRYPGIEKGVVGLLARVHFPPAKVLFSSFDLPTLTRLRALCPQARIGVLTRAFDVRDALNVRAESVHLNHTRFTPQIAQVCHQNGLKVFLYTVNDVDLACSLGAQGADGIFTDCIGDFIR